MKKLILLTAFASVFIISSCKKDEEMEEVVIQWQKPRLILPQLSAHQLIGSVPPQAI